MNIIDLYAYCTVSCKCFVYFLFPRIIPLSSLVHFSSPSSPGPPHAPRLGAPPATVLSLDIENRETIFCLYIYLYILFCCHYNV